MLKINRDRLVQMALGASLFTTSALSLADNYSAVYVRNDTPMTFLNVAIDSYKKQDNCDNNDSQKCQLSPYRHKKFPSGWGQKVCIARWEWPKYPAVGCYVLPQPGNPNNNVLSVTYEVKGKYKVNTRTVWAKMQLVRIKK